MWQLKTFPAKTPTLEAMDRARARAETWHAQNEGRYQLIPVFIRNGYAFEYREVKEAN